MDTKHIHYFCTVYELQSINKAARQLYISPQGLSKIIGHLESELGADLFFRTKQGMLPTEAGTHFYKYSRSIFFKLEELKYGIRNIQNREKKLMIGFSCGTLNLFHFSIVRNLPKVFPSFHIQWEEDNNTGIMNKIMENTLDVAFVIGDPVPDELQKLYVFSSTPHAIVYEGHPFYDKEVLTIEDLKEQPLIILNEKFHTYHELIRRCHDFGFSPDIIAKTMESSLIYQFVKEKYGIGIDVDIHNDQTIRSGLRQIPVAEAFHWNVYMVYKEEKCDTYPIESLYLSFKNALRKTGNL